MSKTEKDQNEKSDSPNQINTIPIPISIEGIKGSISISTRNSKKISGSKLEIINKAINLHKENKLLEASKLYQYCIENDFNDPGVYSNYAIILKSKGKLDEAEIYLRKAIEINKDYPTAYYNLGNTLRELRKLIEAFNSYIRVIELSPKDNIVYQLVIDLLGELNPESFSNERLEYILDILLERNDIDHTNLMLYFTKFYSFDIKKFLGIAISELNQNESFFSILHQKIVILGLKKIQLRDCNWEILLTKIRKDICIQTYQKIKNINYRLDFLIALAEQCHINEYVFSCTSEEEDYVNILIERCKHHEMNEWNLSVLACYCPLYNILDRIAELNTLNSKNHDFNKLIEIQIEEPLKERKISKSIKSIGLINNKISKQVKSQYEENPYPRWKYNIRKNNQKDSTVEFINNNIKPNSIEDSFKNNKVSVLIAGCGTGQHIIHAQEYNNAEITAIDLSIPSLSYAKRKLNEMNVENVELIQMDLLNVNLLDRKFDIIESSGVLHHMDDPMEGTNSLLKVLKKGGLLKVGLYSEIARKDLNKAREFIKLNKLKPDEKGIKLFREAVLSDKFYELNSIKNWGDFYTTSMCRDMCFHAKEHRFTIEKIINLIEKYDLIFLGFVLPVTTKEIYKKYFPDDILMTNLENWSIFEKSNPNTFRSMYQFWVKK